MPNLFEPPAARLDPDLAAPNRPVVLWIARTLGALCVVASIARIGVTAVVGTRSGLGFGELYLMCMFSVPPALAGVLVFMRSRHALVACIAAAVLRLLLAPWLDHLTMLWLHIPDDAFDYGHALFEALHPPSPSWLFEALLIGFCMWDYRRRFAAWRSETPDRESPPVGSS